MQAYPFEPSPGGTEQTTSWRAYLRFFLFAWATYLVTTPFYVFAPGNPQPSDGFIAILIMILLTGYGLRMSVHRDLYLVAAFFLAYVALVNWFWWTQEKDLRFLLSSLYYPFNFFVFAFTVSLLYKFGVVAGRVTQVALTVAALLVLVITLLNVGGGRQTGTFNNPNQLGYWALLAMACFLVAKGDERLRLIDLTFILPACYLAALSLSKAAIISIAAMLVVSVVGQGMERKLKIAVVALLIVASPIIAMETAAVGEFLSQGTAGAVFERIDNIGKQKDDSLAGRGYDRIWLYPQYLIFGAGEGAYKRFSLSQALGQEIHSSFGTILFAYGIFGSVLFALVLCIIFRHAQWRDLVYMSGPVLYGLTHQGLRTTLLWVFLGLVYGMAHHVRRPFGLATEPQPMRFRTERAPATSHPARQRP
jgi:O-Antigen ligase